jgi:hypothetical protein
LACCTAREPVKVPEVVTGEPETVKMPGKARATEVTVPAPVAAMVSDPAPGVMEMPVPAVREATV